MFALKAAFISHRLTALIFLENPVQPPMNRLLHVLYYRHIQTKYPFHNLSLFFIKNAMITWCF